MIPLVVRSHYSLMRGTASPAALCEAAKAKGYAQLALTDVDNLYGLWPFLKACRRFDLTPIVGAEITDRVSGQRAVCLVKNDAGYANLCRLITARQMDAGFRLANAMVRCAEGLIVLCDDAKALELWRGRGVEVVAHLSRSPNGRARRLRQAARRLGIACVASPDGWMAEREEFALHRILRAIDLNASLFRLGDGDTVSEEAHLAPPEEIQRRFAVWPEAIEETHRIAERIGFRGPDTRLIFPEWNDPEGRTPAEALGREAYLGAARRYGDPLPQAAIDRLDHELRRIEEKGFSGYFLTVRDIILRSPRICGRGSGAASLVAYCLGITNVCPLKHNLYFERFLNPGRIDPPDIDVDFAWDERDAVIDSVLAGHEGHAAMVANHVFFKPRMAIRETAKAFGLPEGEIGQVTSRLPWLWRQESEEGDLQSRLEGLTEMRSARFDEPWPEILRIAQRLIGAPRCLSVHPGGTIITPRPIDEYVPIQRATKGVPIIQWEKDAAEEAGLVKIDLLGNRSLGVIRDAIENLRANGEALDEARWEPEDDPATQRTVAEGRTMGCFYIESPAMRLLQKRAGKGDFEHLVIHSSIIRPAANEFIREYLKRLRGGAWEPLHPLLEETLRETYGIMVYQEDVSRVAVSMAGFSDTDADRLRKILSKKEKEVELADYAQRFAAGARRRGVGESIVHRVWAMMMSFDGYSFCKPHSASYARVSFQAAWLKTHYPAEFMAAVIANQGGFYSTFAYVSEAMRLGLTVGPPCVNESEIAWRGRGRAVRVGLQSIKGLQRETMERIVGRRRERPYADGTDFLQRVGPDEEEMRALVGAGALDGFGEDHPALLWRSAQWRRPTSKSNGLFGDMGRSSTPTFPETAPAERRRREFDALGFLCGLHPMALYRPQLDLRRGVVRAAELSNHVGRRVRFAGWRIAGKIVRAKTGQPMEFLTFEDETGLAETTFFPETYQRFCDRMETGRPYLLEGIVEEEWGAVTLTVDRVEPLKPTVETPTNEALLRGFHSRLPQRNFP